MRIFRADTLQEAAYDEIVSMLRAGRIIAFPTDTAYGLGADPYNTLAVERIFKIKGRSESKPIILVVNSLDMAEEAGLFDDTVLKVAQNFWPGPLTLVVKARSALPSILMASTGTIGIRWPEAGFGRALLERFRHPITATSANISGRPAALTAQEVQTQLGAQIDALIDGGPLRSRTGSTLLDVTVDPPVLLREGPISFARLHEFFEGRIRRQVA